MAKEGTFSDVEKASASQIDKVQKLGGTTKGLQMIDNTETALDENGNPIKTSMEARLQRAHMDNLYDDIEKLKN